MMFWVGLSGIFGASLWLALALQIYSAILAMVPDT